MKDFCLALQKPIQSCKDERISGPQAETLGPGGIAAKYSNGPRHHSEPAAWQPGSLQVP